MYKFISFVLILVMIVSAIVGCNKSDENTIPTPTVAKTPVVTELPTSTVEITSSPSLTPEPGTNVALNKSYEVSSETDYNHVQWGWSSEFLVDGIKENDPMSQGWSSDIKQFMDIEDWEEQWVIIDIGQVVLIDKVMLYPRQDNAAFFPCDYHIEVSTDNKQFNTVVSKTDDIRERDIDFEPAILAFDEVSARYVKLVITKPWPEGSSTNGFVVQLAELEIYTIGSE